MWLATLILACCYVRFAHPSKEMTSGQHGSPWNTRDNDYYYDPLHPDDTLPAITTTPITDRLASLGEDLILPCVVENLGEFSLTWHHGENILWILQEKSDGPFVTKVVQEPRVSRAGTSLAVADVRATDTGNYTCEVNTQPPRAITHTLAIKVPPSVHPANNRSMVTVKSGHSITLGCHAQGNPQPTITWTRKGGSLEELLTGPNLTLAKAQPEDNGYYKCKADNGERTTASATIILQVMYPPKVQAESEVVYAGMKYDATLACVVEGEPQPQVKWYRMGGQPVNPLRLHKAVDARKRFSLQFSTVQRDDFGDYTCNATNFMGNGSAVISLQGRPKPVRYYSLGKGENDTCYTLIWHVESYSPVLTYNIAYKNESDLEDQWVNFTVPGTSSSSRYHSSSHTFTQLEPGATYHVQVTATNEFGESDVNQTFSFTTFNSVPVEGGVSEVPPNTGVDASGSGEVQDTSGNLTEKEGPVSIKKDPGEESAAASVQDGTSGVATLNLTPAERRTQMVAFVTAISLSCFF